MKNNIIITILFFAFGTIIGSFLNVLIYRIPREKDFVKGRSACPHCGHTLSAFDMIPIVSYALLKGKCRYCGARISPVYPIIETITGLSFATIYYIYGISVNCIALIILISTLIVISGIDATNFLVPDSITITVTAIGIIASIFTIGLKDSIMGIIFLGGIFALIRAITKGKMGDGDITIGAMIGSFIGLKLSIIVFMLSFLIGGLYGIYFLIKNRKRKLTEEERMVPFGPFLSIATLIAIILGNTLIYLILPF